jgi:antibiotic biosynthesis monooxygenase (ABM) superfamily enzyme
MTSATAPLSNISTDLSGAVTIVTQTRVVPGHELEFAVWQETISAAVAGHAGFIDQKVMPPSPPIQVDWVILQRFTSLAGAQQWMRSDCRADLIAKAQSMMVGNDDVHIVADSGAGVLPSPASAVISTHVKPGQEAAYRDWERRIAAAQTRAPGFQGYRVEPPVPGVQESWLAIVRFDSDASLERWMASPERQQLLQEGAHLSDKVSARIVRTGFDQWFPTSGSTGGPPPPAWKQNMLVLLMLYPVVFLFGYLVQGPLLMKVMSMPFWLALFVGNLVGVLLLNTLVPWTCARFGWWLQPDPQKPEEASKVNLKGIGIILALYALSMLVFSQLH